MGFLKTKTSYFLHNDAMQCSSDVLKKTSPLDVFGDVSEKVKHLTNDASNDVSPPALS